MVDNMTMKEFLQLHAKDMLDVIKNDPDFRYNPEAGKAFNKKAFEESKQQEIERYGDYVGRWYIDPLPRNRIKKG